jgi:hypothetical protein
MKQHVIPAAVAAIVAAVVSGVAYRQAPDLRGTIMQAPAPGLSFGESTMVSDAKARLNAARQWPEMTQQEVDDLTARLKKIGEGRPVTIYCINARCEDLALNLDNAFESARWKSEVLNGVMIPPGIACSSKDVCDAFNAATGGRYAARLDAPGNAQGDYVAIGFRQRAG